MKTPTLSPGDAAMPPCCDSCGESSETGFTQGLCRDCHDGMEEYEAYAAARRRAWWRRLYAWLTESYRPRTGGDDVA